MTFVDLQKIDSWEPMIREQDEYRNALVGLLPRGDAWNVFKGSNWWKLLNGIASGLKAVYDDLRMCVINGDPAKTNAFVTFERELGLPWDGLEKTLSEERLLEIYRISRQKGGCTKNDVQKVINLFGLDIELYEYKFSPSEFVDDLGHTLPYSDDFLEFSFLVKIPMQEDAQYMDCNSACDSYIGYWFNIPIEKTINRIKPAHTKAIYKYYRSEE